MDFVDQVDLELTRRGGDGDVLFDAADLLDAAVAGRVQFDQVEGAPGKQINAGLAFVAGLTVAAVGAVERAAEEAARAGLAGAPWPGEEVGVGDAAGLQRVGQRLGDVLLPGEVAEGPRAPLAIEDFRDCSTPAPGGFFAATGLRPLYENGPPKSFSVAQSGRELLQDESRSYL